MVDKCPKCGELLVTRTIKKELGLGSIEIPVAEVCPKCNWNRDLTGAGDIKPAVTEDIKKVEEKPQAAIKRPEKPVVVSAPPKTQPKPEAQGFNRLLTIILALLVVGGLVWAFFLYPAADKQPSSSIPSPTPAPQVTETPAAPATVIATGAPISEAAPTGKKILLKMDRNVGFINLIQGSLKIKPGDDVIFTNDGTYPLTLVSADNLFEPKFLDNGKRTNYTFKKPGTYSFYIKENKNLSGTIAVET